MMKGTSVKRKMKKLCICFIFLGLLTFLTAGCAPTKTYRHDVTSGEVMDTVLASIPDMDGYRPVGEGYVCRSLWGDGYEDLTQKTADYRIMLSQNADMNINEVGVFRVRDVADVDELAETVETFVEGQRARYAGLLSAYNPTELPKLEEAEVEVCGRYIFYSILSEKDTAKAKKAFETAVTKN